jgi:hypothetical protein
MNFGHDSLTKAFHPLPLQTVRGADGISINCMGHPSRSFLTEIHARFTSHFWRQFQNALSTKESFSSPHHPQTDGQSERTIQTCSDMLRACALTMSGAWSDHLHLAEFAYNNCYHASIGMAPKEALYGNRCRTLICWVTVLQEWDQYSVVYLSQVEVSEVFDRVRCLSTLRGGVSV